MNDDLNKRFCKLEEIMNVYYQDSVIPSKAGAAKLHYDKDVKEPKREKEDIVIPQLGYSLYQLTAGFEQFLAIKNEPEKHDSRYGKPFKSWFGGTDERPFLVRLSDKCSTSGQGYDWPTVWRKGDFFKQIVPEAVLWAKKKGYKVKRQGDIFAVKHPIQDWDLLRFVQDSSSNFRCGPSNTKDREKRGLPLFGTRHILKGEYIKQDDHYGNHPNYYDIVCRGNIEAPDHEILDLNELHGLWQTKNLFDAEKAD